MAKVGMRHRENFNEIVGNLSRDAVQLTHPNRMAILAMNNKIFSDGLENHLEQQQPTQNPTQQVYSRPPPQVAPYVPNAPLPQRAPIEASAAADGPPSWMGMGAAGLGRAANLGGSALGGMFSGLAQSGVAVARSLAANVHAQEAARQVNQGVARPAIGDDDTRSIGWYTANGDDDQSITGGSDLIATEDAQRHHELQLRMHGQDMQNATAQRTRDEIRMIENIHQQNPFADGGRTLELYSQNTLASADLLQLVIQAQYPPYPYDGSDLLELPPPPPPPLPPPPPPAGWRRRRLATVAKGQTSDDKLDEMIAKHIAEKQAKKAARDAAKTTKVRSKYGTTTYPAAPVTGDKRTKPQFSTDQSRPKKTKTAPPAEQDTTQYRKPRKVPGQTSDEKIEHLVRQRSAGVGQLPSENTNPFAGVF